MSASLHLFDPQKSIRFIKSGELSDETPKNETPQLDGEEIRRFYEEVIQQPSTSGTNVIKVEEVEEIEEDEIEILDVVPPNIKKSRTEFTDRDLRLFFKAAELDDVDTLFKYIQDGIDIDSKDEYGWSVFMCSAAAGSALTIQLLLERGVDFDYSLNGMNAEQLARKNKHFAIANFIADLRKEQSEDSVKLYDLIEEKHCAVCGKSHFDSNHDTSILHLLKLNERPSEGYAYGISPSNPGYRLLKLKKWSEGQGLGASGKQGRKYPIRTALKRDKKGLGLEKTQMKVTHFEPMDPNAALSAKRPKRTFIRQLDKELKKKKDREIKVGELQCAYPVFNVILSAFLLKTTTGSKCRTVKREVFHDSPAKVVVVTSEELNKLVKSQTRVAFSELAIIILKLDFDEHDDESNQFQSNIIKQIIKNAALPKDVYISIDDLNDNIATQIEIIKQDPYIVKQSATCLLSAQLLTFLGEGKYDARVRVLLKHLAAFFSIDFDKFRQIEDTLTECLIEGYKESEAEQNERKRSDKIKKIKRYALIGGSATIGGVLIGLTGGLAAPLVAGGIGLFVGGGVATALASASLQIVLQPTAGAAIFGSVFGVAGASLTGYKMNRRVGAIDEFQLEILTEGKSLHCVLCVSGWVNEKEEAEELFKADWEHLQLAAEQYTLRYESKYMIELGKAIEYFVSIAASYAIQTALMQTAIAGVLSALAWPIVLVSASSVIDNPWNVMISRSAEVGQELADVLIQRSQGQRPVTLIGFSLGARVIFNCLLSLQKKEGFRGIIEDVILLGAPITGSHKEWSKISQVVGGRIINGYCTTDWLLRFLYRTMSVQFSIAGTAPVDTKKNRKISQASNDDLKAYCEKQEEAAAKEKSNDGKEGTSKDVQDELSHKLDSAHIEKPTRSEFTIGSPTKTPSENA
ncbi:hypothetical protein M3Y97_00601600 [Aphelenchoides bicaudatus]|nr:hypothetical protein M3Y97_00601600 [Aphelenchoides bicaudatus]